MKKENIKFWIGAVVGIMAIIGSYTHNRVDYALIKDQVQRNTEDIATAKKERDAYILLKRDVEANTKFREKQCKEH